MESSFRACWQHQQGVHPHTILFSKGTFLKSFLGYAWLFEVKGTSVGARICWWVEIKGLQILTFEKITISKTQKNWRHWNCKCDRTKKIITNWSGWKSWTSHAQKTQKKLRVRWTIRFGHGSQPFPWRWRFRVIPEGNRVKNPSQTGRVGLWWWLRRRW